MKNNDNDAPEQMEGFNARLRGIESIIKQAMQKNTNLTLNFFLSSVGQHVERTDSAHVWMRKDDDMETQTFGSKGDADGAQHVDSIQTQYFGMPHDASMQKKGNPVRHENNMPEVLRTPEAMVLWKKAQAAGYVDENYQPLLSRTQSALLADAMAVRLGIREKWKAFETFWNRRNMYRDYYKALYLQQSLTFQDEIKNLFR